MVRRMRHRTSVLSGHVLALVLAAAVIGACSADVGDASPLPSLRPSTGPAGAPSAAIPDPTQGTIGDFAPIEGAHLLVRAARDTAPAVGEDAVEALAHADSAFALDLYRELAAASDENIVLGPHSISSALAMVYAGAHGRTAAEMAQVLHFDGAPSDIPPVFNALDLALAARSQEGVIDLRLANQGFAAPGLPLLDSYLVTLGRDFGAPMAEIEFTDEEDARRVINGWAADRTNDRITELFPEGVLTPDTRLVVVNAVAMDAAWKYLFDPAQTTDKPFHLTGADEVEVPTMHFDLYLPLATDERYDAVELPYGDGDLSMVIILPKKLDAFEREVDPDRLRSIFAAISEQGIHLSLPKFAFSSHMALDEVLKHLGMASAYGDGADFSGMTGSQGLFLQTVQHEAFIEVDEEGTEAHAATGAGMALSHGPTITIDRPFFFVIRDRPTGAILFLGRVTDPRG
jgi:serpin B